ncbi:MAG: hypothetical protein IPH35_03375 [Rhodoferax sp.]|nr:hypothetical protein [Rhodoferax sp.]
MSVELKGLCLKCPNCGATLEVAPDLNQFSCGYCGSEQVVLRRGGTVALSLIGDAITKVQVGTDKTAAELAIKRLRDDLTKEAVQCQNLISMAKIKNSSMDVWSPRVPFFIGFGLFFILFSNKNSSFGIVIGIIFIAIGIWIASAWRSQLNEYAKEASKITEAYKARCASISKEIDEKLNLVKSS